mmetsp:Transcript_10753/g.29525  ORF Transcript_10753/g.29525 Transcript_10753/m.29525 type:complete len:118 (+) Transcript_10753:612-965(+)
MCILDCAFLTVCIHNCVHPLLCMCIASSLCVRSPLCASTTLCAFVITCFHHCMHPMLHASIARCTHLLQQSVCTHDCVCIHHCVLSWLRASFAEHCRASQSNSVCYKQTVIFTMDGP